MSYINNSGGRTEFSCKHGKVSYDIQQLPHCCGITYIHGFIWRNVNNGKKLYEAFHKHLTAPYFGAGTEWGDQDFENEDARQLNRCMLMVSDAVGGENEGGYNIYDMCKIHGWEGSKHTPFNHNSGNKVQIFTWNKEENSDSND